MGDVPTMIRNGQNTAQKYAYVTAEDVKAAIRPLLAKHRVSLFAEMVEVQRETSVNKNGTGVVTVIAKMRFTFLCGDTGEKMACDWFGEANDYADKCVNKAATAATKYFLINTFLLSTTEPESDEEEVPAPAPVERCDVCESEVNPKAAAATLKFAGAVLCKTHFDTFRKQTEQEEQPA